MTTPIPKGVAKHKMLPYRKMGEIDYDALEFAPDVWEWPPDHMEQSHEIAAVFTMLSARLTDFHTRHDIFVDMGTNVCYDPSNLNVRLAPDVYVAFGVDELAIRPRRIYLPWEAGKPPDWALEVASHSTRRVDLNNKPAIYQRIGVPEFWRFDPTGGRYYRFQLDGLKLVDGEYQTIELTTEPDGILKGYSEVLELSLAWDEGWPRFYDPATGLYLEEWRDHIRALHTEREARAADQTALQAEREARAADQAALHTEREARAADQAALHTEREARTADQAALQAEREARAADQAALHTEREARAADQTVLQAEREARAADQERVRQLEEELRRLRGNG